MAFGNSKHQTISVIEWCLINILECCQQISYLLFIEEALKHVNIVVVDADTENTNTKNDATDHINTMEPTDHTTAVAQNNLLSQEGGGV